MTYELAKLRAETTRLRGAAQAPASGGPATFGSGAGASATGDTTQLVQEGWQLLQTGKLAEAIPAFEAAVKLDPKNSDAWNGLGWASFRSGKTNEAEKAFQQTVELQPDHPAALNGLGQMYLSEKKYAEAEQYLLKAGSKAPAAWYGLAKLYLLQDKFEDAEKWAQTIVDSGQGDEGARAMLKAAKDKKISDGLRLMLDPQ
jgi:Flp pilus assembly protein TadD